MRTKEEITKLLEEPIPRSVIAKRAGGGGRTLDYLEGWYVIDRMNQIFGNLNWSYSIIDLKPVFVGEVKGSHVAHYVAQVELKVKEIEAKGGDSLERYNTSTYFHDVGYGNGSDKFDPGKAHELAVKEAVTDGIKRAAKNLGRSMGLALYDKSQEHVAEEEVPKVPAPKESAKPNEAKAQTSFVMPTKRNDILKSIDSTYRTVVAKKKATLEQLRDVLKSKYSVETSQKLTDTQAQEFLTELNAML